MSHVKYSRLRQDLPLSINERVIVPFPEGFIFTKLRQNKVLAKISEFTVIMDSENPDQTSPFSRQFLILLFNSCDVFNCVFCFHFLMVYEKKKKKLNMTFLLHVSSFI